MTMAMMAMMMAASVTMPAQTPPVSEVIRQQNQAIGELIVAAAERIPESEYTFRPVPTVRSVGDLLLHIAGVQHSLCGFATGAKPPVSPVLQRYASAKSDYSQAGITKVEVTAALKGAFAYCHATLAGTTPDQANRVVPGAMLKNLLGMTDGPAYGYQMYVLTHTWEHYGNLVTYMRLRGLVPPTSAR